MTGTLVYDADCGFCTTTADWLSGHSGCEVEPWQSLDLAAVGLTVADVTSAAWWLSEGEPPRRGARAVAASLRESDGRALRLAGRLIDLPPVRPFAAAGYAVVARYRYLLPGSTDACRMR